MPCRNFGAAITALATLGDLPRLQLAAKAALATCPLRRRALALQASGSRKNVREAAAALLRCGLNNEAAKLYMKNNMWTVWPHYPC